MSTSSSDDVYDGTVDIPELFVKYLRTSSRDEQREIAAAHPQLFTDEIVLALEEARSQIGATLREVKEACRTIDVVSGSLAFAPANLGLLPNESSALLDEETVLRQFTTSLAGLLAARAPRGRPCSTGTRVLASERTPDTSTQEDAGKETLSAMAGPWYAQPSFVLAILSYLSAEEVFMKAENVCREWRMWLLLPDISRFFWVGCVQREFPQHLRLLSSLGDDLYQRDWRSIAMLCVTETEEPEAA